MDKIIKYKSNIAKKQASYLIAVLICLIALPGCSSDKDFSNPADYYYLNPEKDISTTGRVTILELDNNTLYPQISQEITETLFQAIQKKHLFGLTVLHKSDELYKELQLDLSTPFTLEQLSQIRKQLNSNAIFVGSVNIYQPYPHMSIGLDLRIIDLTDGQLLWALEQIWDATDKATEHRIAKYYNTQMPNASSTLEERLVSISSRNFTKFVTYEISQTLKP